MVLGLTPKVLPDRSGVIKLEIFVVRLKPMQNLLRFRH